MSEGWASQDIIRKFFEMKNRTAKGKYQAVSDESHEMDPKTAYKLHQPGSLEYARFWFQCLLIYGAQDPQDRQLMLIASHAIVFIESRMDKHAVKPDILYDDTLEGDIRPMLMTPGGERFSGGLKDYADLLRGKD